MEPYWSVHPVLRYSRAGLHWDQYLTMSKSPTRLSWEARNEKGQALIFGLGRQKDRLHRQTEQKIAAKTI